MIARYPARRVTLPLTPRQHETLRAGRGDGQSAQGVLDRGLATHATRAKRGALWRLHLTPLGRQWRRDLRRRDAI